ncbi:MAG: hypothetical protein KDC36_09535, partial [Thermoleophilia bacterium]|nr:hypothetical protein [Thermoleophilia bacterium]
MRDDPRAGRERADAIVEEARELGNTAAEATALRARAWAEREVFDYDAAVGTLARASTLARRIGLAELD